MAKILLVDDEPGVRHVIVGMLRLEKHDVTPASHAEQAQSILQTEAFDLLISDIVMEPINGLELLKFARTTCPDMAVVMMTAYASVEQAVESIRGGSFDYVIKPFNCATLFATIHRALDSQAIRDAQIDDAFPSHPIAPSDEFNRTPPFDRPPTPRRITPLSTTIEEEWSVPQT